MAIPYHCRCGANIRMPTSAAGRKARCSSCGAVFTVPAPGTPPPGTTPSPAAPEGRRRAGCPPPEEAGSILADLADGERLDLLAEPPPRQPNDDDRLLKLADEPDILAPPVKPPRRVVIETDEVGRDEERSGVIGPQQPFWRDLVASFVFFLDAGSFVTFVVIVMIHAWMILLSFAPLIGFAGRGILWGYLCAFYFSIVLDTASGEDELPNIWIHSAVDDLLMPALRFVGTWALVLLPAAGLIIFSFAQGQKIPWTTVAILAGVGAFFWPVVVLGVAIGGSFRGLWPHTVIQTVLAAPLAYLAIWAVLLIAAGITFLPETDAYAVALNTLFPSMSLKIVLLIAMLSCAFKAYAMILSMRVIGLYYRHFKQKFPWVAE